MSLQDDIYKEEDDMARRFTPQEWIEKFKEKHNTEFEHYDYSSIHVIKNSHQKVRIKCIKHDILFEMRVWDHCRGQGCKLCSEEKKRMRMSFDNEEVDERLKEVNKNVIRIGQFVNSSTILEWGCKICKFKWMSQPSNILKKNNPTGCPKCSRRVRITNEEIDERLSKRNIKRLEDVKFCTNPISWQCTKKLFDGTLCNFKWDASPNNIQRGTGCPKCTNHIKMTESFIDERLQGRNILRLDSVTNSKVPMKWKCLVKDCNFVWSSIYNSVIRNKLPSGCPRCDFSKGEKELERLCNSLNLESFPEKWFDDCRNPKTDSLLYFDRWIPSKDVLIEYQGEYHYAPHTWNGKENISLEDAENNFQRQQYRDNLKVEYCKQKGIKLIIIPYWEFDRIEEIIKQQLSLS